MFKKLRRFIIKKTLAKELFGHLRNLNLLNDEQPKLLFDHQLDCFICFELKTDNNLFDGVYFHDSGPEKMTVSVRISGTRYYETLIFSVSKWLTLKPKTYTIRKKYSDAYVAQTIDFNSGKITLLNNIAEYSESNLEDTLSNLITEMSTGLLTRNILKANIVVSDFGEKTYKITQEISKPVLKPESTINFKQFYKLANIF